MRGESPPDVEFLKVSKTFGDVLAVDKVDLSVERGAFYSFLGPSGCGKTTSLRLIAGFEQPTEGEVRVAGRSVVGVPPHRRPVNMVFQHYALFPHLNVADNIAYGLRQQSPRPSRAEISRRVGETLELVRLPGFDRRRTWELSGGQQQRVALARALINQPTVLLLDEPLAALDRKLRREMQIELQTLQREVGITFVLVTHDQEEALSMSDRICIMRAGRIVQIGTPSELYDQPVNSYVADFVGKSNFFPGTVERVNGVAAVVRCDLAALQARVTENAERLAPGDKAVIALRPELIELRHANDAPTPDAATEARGVVKNRIFLGEHTEYLVVAEGLGEVLSLVPKHVEATRGGFMPGDEVTVAWLPGSALALRQS